MARKKDHVNGTKTVKRDAHGRFVKGSAPANPTGRPKNDSVADRLFPLVPKAIARIEMILDNPDSTSRDVLKAAEIVIDRVYGKAFQSVQIDQADATVRIVDTDPEGAAYNA